MALLTETPRCDVSWIGLILAPLLVPVTFSAALLIYLGEWQVVSFLFLVVPALVISYGTTIFLFLPCLFVLSLFRPVTAFWACLLGLLLGALVFVPLTLLAWKGSGPDSGPPTENFLIFFARSAADPVAVLFPLGGLITAGLYWSLGTWRRARSMTVQK